MNILITGGTGFIGSLLCEALQRRGHHLTVLSRSSDKVRFICGEKVRAIRLLEELTPKDHFQAIINLAGENIADGRWTLGRKQVLIESRVKTTEQLLDFINRAEHKPDVLISGSAIGYYGNQEDKELDEDSEAVSDFAHKLCVAWEQAAMKAEYHGVRVCILRTGLVIGAHGGFLQRLIFPFKYGLGGILGNGKQWMSWVHREDIVRIIGVLLIDPKFSGIYNATSPKPVTNKEFTKCLARTLKRPALLFVPGKILKMLLGEISELLLGGQKVLPKRLLEQNFVFKYETIDKALQEVVLDKEN